MAIIILFYILYFDLVLSAESVMEYPNIYDREALIQFKKEAKQKEISPKTITPLILHGQSMSEVKQSINHIDPEIKSVASPSEKKILLIHDPSKQQSIDEMIKTLKPRQDQLLIQCIIYEISTDSEKELNALNLPTESSAHLDYNSPITIKHVTHYLDIIKALEYQGKALLISNPTLKILNNQTATFSIGHQIPYITQTITQTASTQSLNQIETGLTMTLHPTITTSSTIDCSIQLSLNNISLWKTVNNQQYPVVSTKKLNLNTLLSHNTASLIAHFNDQLLKENTESTPFLRKIPILKHIFGAFYNQNKSSLLLIFLKPTIIEKEKALE